MNGYVLETANNETPATRRIAGVENNCMLLFGYSSILFELMLPSFFSCAVTRVSYECSSAGHCKLYIVYDTELRFKVMLQLGSVQVALSLFDVNNELRLLVLFVTHFLCAYNFGSNPVTKAGHGWTLMLPAGVCGQQAYPSNWTGQYNWVESEIERNGRKRQHIVNMCINFHLNFGDLKKFIDFAINRGLFLFLFGKWNGAKDF